LGASILDMSVSLDGGALSEHADKRKKER